MSKLNTINNILGFGFLIIPTYLLLFTESNPWIVIPFYFIFILYFSLKWIDKRKKLNISEYIYLFGLLLVYFNMNGEFFFGLYYKLIYYDKFLHLIVPIYLAFVANLILIKHKRLNFFLIISIVFGICVSWEIFEYFIDAYSGTTIMQGVVINLKELSGGFEDTLSDLSFSLIGTIIGAIIVFRINKHKLLTKRKK